MSDSIGHSDAGDTPLRVLRVYHSGVVSAWRERDRGLRAAGCEVTTVSPLRWNEGGEVVELVVAPGEPVVRAATLGSHPFRFVYDPRPIWRALRGGEWDVLDIHEEPAALATAEVLVLAWLAGVRPAVALYSAQNIAKRYPPPFRWFERVALRRAAAVHTCNDEVGPILRAKGFRGRVENLGLGVDVAHFAPEAVRDAGGVAAGAPAERSTPNPAPESVRETVAAGAFQVGYVGRLEARKGIFVLLDAVAGLSDVEVTFVGAGRDADRLAGEVAGRRLGGRATVDGFVAFDDLPGCYRRFDVVVVPSLDRPNWIEQFGRVVVEAMATGVPVVASDSGSLPEVVADAGLVVPQGDAGALAAALERLRDDAALRVDLAVRGRRRAEHFSWSSIAARQADLYRAISWQSDRVVGSEGEGADEDVPHGDAPTS